MPTTEKHLPPLPLKGESAGKAKPGTVVCSGQTMDPGNTQITHLKGQIKTLQKRIAILEALNSKYRQRLEGQERHTAKVFGAIRSAIETFHEEEFGGLPSELHGDIAPGPFDEDDWV
ncbi:hypothetical protein NCS57_00347500 [Fusarium keratoplasticum]|uniref:Uncharacterized protein n=1 Tax=Fusarium keratoplasticum TaxID=1328300 RepID=A0ACC0R2F9_9HYPO|nr:hypothetical protein NCS57_00347500 [Fusarium keratoplasticum]KAI8674496.1 hypothetical protein NCS57_00347500 [Fusarium keratoplasticum]